MHKLAFIGALLFAALPATSNYKLNSYGFGSGGTAGSSTATYSIEGSSGEFHGQATSTITYTSKPGFTQTQQANLPGMTIDNGSGLYYNMVHFVVDPQNNPSDATYLIAVSTDNFATNTTYVQPDGTLSTTLSLSDYQTYSAWGGASGSDIIGLNASSTYWAKIRATQGKHTESAYALSSPTSVTLTAPSMTFGLSTSASAIPPFTVSLGTLNAGIVATGNQTINTAFETNGSTGGDVYIKSQNAGLLSGSTGYKINSISNDLDLGAVSEGFGGQNSSISQSTGSFTVVSPYNGSTNNIGAIDSSLRSLYTATAPIVGGTAVFNLKAKAAQTDIAATDYQEVLTLVAAANF